ncbi:MAG: DegT/DnrJ/EryC1/StrS family aminotransferase [Candidatus Omnitrophica bacterium]|nr:DegT/DnrJ/EryC1/StrS family aminotransferase [Candidatus Omnitrophota bacterium]
MPGYELYGTEERDAVIAWFNASHGVMMAHGFDRLRQGIFKVREFERAVADTMGCAYAQAVSSGTAALFVALRALGVGPGDEVITQAFTFVATVEAILATGATPVITEVDRSLTMDPTDFERRITPRTKVVIPVHMAGAAADLETILAIAARHRVTVVEDACQAVGGAYRGKPLGSFGTMGVLSFDFAKTITTGEGGMVVTNDRTLFERARAIHDHGHEYHPERPRGQDTRSLPGFNFRLTEIQGVLGLTQLAKLPLILSRQRANKVLLKTGIADCGFEFRHLHDPEGDLADTCIFFLEERQRAAAFAAALERRGFTTKNLPGALSWHYAGTWDHLFRGISSLDHPEKRWPKTDDLLHRAIALPVNVAMSEGDLADLIAAVRDSAKDARCEEAVSVLEERR